MTIGTALITRIEKLILLLGSSHDGEVLAAARVLDRVLRSENWDWHDLVRQLHGDDRPPTPWRSVAEWCVSRSQYLTDWEREFIRNVIRWRATPTQKQPQ